MRLKDVPDEEPEWDVDSYDGREYQSDPEDRKYFSDEDEYNEYRLDKREKLESKGFIPDFANGIHNFGNLDEPAGKNRTINDELTELASVCVKKFNEEKGKCVELVSIVRGNISGGPHLKVYITFMAREYENGPLVEYQAKVMRYAAHRKPPSPILCRPSPKPTSKLT
ncbi:uncharacterized protein LOC17883530 [Capsella rubella]|uniref:uncharacterized protein LOC17883530 n=1 Tax=Capsella rubella TaxID=81985 RepID=UPI000CD5A245|nr:uncharacterized protein LOC17883530 [Capsella rubella]XP_023636181.1 uncharacterized protein LOC17883530 [Capsella rubella]XP_023636182.1 uncharacterized protein LOC17883530 [Capsella rubella]